jgi:hypothetical protein
MDYRKLCCGGDTRVPPKVGTPRLSCRCRRGTPVMPAEWQWTIQRGATDPTNGKGAAAPKARRLPATREVQRTSAYPEGLHMRQLGDINGDTVLGLLRTDGLSVSIYGFCRDQAQSRYLGRRIGSIARANYRSCFFCSPNLPPEARPPAMRCDDPAAASLVALSHRACLRLSARNLAGLEVRV